MQHVLRAISGPHAGAVYVLGSRTTIGRASDCDIQILHEGVSRHHAKVTLEDDGSVVVSDLSSDNGTFVEDERVERRVLLEGEVLRVMRSRFAYEVSPVDEVRTSAVFRRKVTSGDSLRQTVHHDKPLTMTRTGLGSGTTGGLPGGMVGERGRAYSRPQAAAPALSGARPGAAVAGRAPEAEAVAEEPAPEALDEGSHVRRPAPPPGVDTSASVRRRRPRAAASSRSEARPSPSRMVTRPPEPAAGPEPRSSEPEPAARIATASSGEPARRVGRGPGRRERSASSPSLASPSGPSAARLERASAPLPASGPSGRMAPRAPSSAESEPEPQASPAAMPISGPASLHAAGSLGSGWIRLTRPLDAPGSMRPGATLSGVPRVGDDESPVVAPRSTSLPPSPAEADASAPAADARPLAAAPERPLKGITAEYGAVGSREVSEPTAAPPEPSAARSAGDTDGELDAMKTLPALRRRGRHAATPRSSATPTEEVPIVREPPPDPAHDDDAHETRPKVTLVPPARGPAPPAGPRSIAYEDTLRFLRPEPGTPAGPERSDVPQPRPHATSAEVISALEALLPDDEVEPSTQRRPDARTHIPSPDAATIEALLDAVVGETAWPTDIAGLSADDQAARRTQQVLEQAEHDHRRREGLERLVDILEYREVRLRALRSHDDAAAAERCTVLEQTLQQHPPAGDDMAAMRRYHRFVCSIPAQLTHRRRGDSMTATVEIEDLSAGGARITFGEFSIDAGETVWLTIDLAAADRSRVPSPEASAVVLKARVVWSHPHAAKLGLVFAGSPDYR